MKTSVGGVGCSLLWPVVICLAMGLPGALPAQQAPDPAVAEQLQIGREARQAGKYKDRHMVKAFEVNWFPTYLVIDGEGAVKQRIAGLNPQESVVYRLKTSLAQLPQLKK